MPTSIKTDALLSEASFLWRLKSLEIDTAPKDSSLRKHVCAQQRVTLRCEWNYDSPCPNQPTSKWPLLFLDVTFLTIVTHFVHDYSTQVRCTERAARAGSCHARDVLYAPVWRMLPEKVSPAEPQLSGHVPAQRHLLLDHPAEGGADLQACDGRYQPGERAQSTSETVSTVRWWRSIYLKRV